MKRLQNPKSLPWLARKAGVSDQTAQALWHEAVALASNDEVQFLAPARMADAMQRLLVMLQAERQERNALLAAAGDTGAARFFAPMSGCAGKSCHAAGLQ